MFSQIVLGTRDNCLLYLEVVSNEIIVKAEKKLDADISCLDLICLGGNPMFCLFDDQFIISAVARLMCDFDVGESVSHSKVAVGTWALDLTVYSLPHLTVSSENVVEGDLPPRSLKFAMFEDCCFLLCALGDGYLLVYPITEVTFRPVCARTGQLPMIFSASLDLSLYCSWHWLWQFVFQNNLMPLCDFAWTQKGTISSRNPRKLSLGTKPVSLHAFKSNGTEYIFAASDRPSVIYYSNKKLLYSNLNQNEV